MGRNENRQNNRAERIKRPRKFLVYVNGNKQRIIAHHPFLTTIAIVFLLSLQTAFVTSLLYREYKDDILLAFLSRHEATKKGYEQEITSLRIELEKLASRKSLAEHNTTREIGSVIAQQTELDDQLGKISQLMQLAKATGLQIDNQKAQYEEPYPVTNDASNTIVPTTTSQDQLRPPASEATIANQSKTATDGTHSSQNNKKINIFNNIQELELRGVKNNEKPLQKHSKSDQNRLQNSANTHNTTAHKQQQLETLAQRLNEAQTIPTRAMQTIADAAEAHISHLESTYNSLKIPLENHLDNLGGPYIPLDGKSFTGQWLRAKAALVHRAELMALSPKIPLLSPLATRRLTSNFGSRLDPFLKKPAFHSGLDFAAPTGTPVMSTALGSVTFSGNKGGYGLSIEIMHPSGVITRYGHMSKLLVAKGDKVLPGQMIGLVGNTGRSTGPHLHYETRINGAAVDPTQFLTAGENI
ncbi:M23 family metallopeptidase [Polycladidibacter stylochi]|uniref:M23 family metallopeptidase n=1 Tax=Polycladidibacter stylochi TaxID=1807766 RepID=UPI0008366C83|nr:M23 family metallopeptidase [Pseudovibrio stylochi]